MFAGFNLQISDVNIFDKYFSHGEAVLRSQRKTIEENLEAYICGDDVLNGTMMQEQWFPSVKADIFLSHSHKDERLIVALAGWLDEVCHVRAFVDSYIWAYSNKLLEKLDNKYCVKERDGDHTTYSYEKRNNSTSHVHMMLNTALEKMIDKSECLFFVNTPNSIDIADTMKIGATLSPWIFSELSLSQIVRHKKLAVYRPDEVYFSRGSVNESASLQIKYNISLEHLKELSTDDLLQWSKSIRSTSSFPLDVLYEQSGLLDGAVL